MFEEKKSHTIFHPQWDNHKPFTVSNVSFRYEVKNLFEWKIGKNGKTLKKRVHAKGEKEQKGKSVQMSRLCVALQVLSNDLLVQIADEPNVHVWIVSSIQWRIVVESERVRG